MTRIALFPGSFDPFTVGHENVVLRALTLFDKIIIAVGQNTSKGNFFTPDQRMNWIKQVFTEEPRITVTKYKGLTVNFAIESQVTHILRGLRTSADFEFERAIAQVNKAMTGIESVFLLTAPEHTPINSTIVRDIIRNGGDAAKFLPEKIKIYKSDIQS